MSTRFLRKMARIHFVFFFAWSLTRLLGFAQTSPISFEVASVKENKSDTRALTVSMKYGNFRTKNVQIEQIIRWAYGLKSDSQLIGLPSSFEDAAYDIDAKPDEATRTELTTKTGEEMNKRYWSMVQALLAERFHLVVHHEVRELPSFALVVEKGPSKLKPLPPATKEDEKGRLESSRGDLKAQRMPLESLVYFLSHTDEVGNRPIVDKTGLKGVYDYHLKWALESQQKAAESTGEVEGPSLFTALKEQLGLKLEPQKTPTDVVVIDHIEKPTEN